MKEKDIEKILVRKVSDLGGKAYKFESPGNAGVPDRLVVFPDGRVVFAELKTDVGRVTPLQDAQIRVLRKLGQQVFVVRGVSGVADFFRELGYGTPDEEVDG